MTIELAGFGYPTADPTSAPFWDAVAERRLLVAKCTSCGGSFMPFSSECSNCGASGAQLTDAGGYGELYTWTVCHRAMDPMFAAATPYVVGLVRLREGASLFTLIVDCDPAALAPGLEVRLCWRTVTPAGLALWAFRPAAHGAGAAELHGEHA